MQSMQKQTMIPQSAAVCGENGDIIDYPLDRMHPAL